MLMARKVGEAILAGLVVNQIENECPHDQTPLLDQRWRGWAHFISGGRRQPAKKASRANRIVSSSGRGTKQSYEMETRNSARRAPDPPVISAASGRRMTASHSCARPWRAAGFFEAACPSRVRAGVWRPAAPAGLSRLRSGL